MEMTKRKEQTSVCMRSDYKKKKDLTQGLAAVVRSKKWINILWRIFTPYSKQIISQEKKKVKSRDEIIEDILEVIDVVEKWRRILLCAAFAACATVFIMCVGVIVQMFLR